MPTMLRLPGRATKIAFRLTGIPANMQSKKTKKARVFNKRLVFEETTRVR